MITAQRPADILDCLANLSSDEVFTPPRVANALLDLLPEEVWSNPGLRWLDPGSKSGVFLREAERRLMEGLAAVIPEEEARREHVLRNMLFGLAITELTALISRRTLYHCRFADTKYSVVRFEDEDGNIRFPEAKHEWSSGRCARCGASERAFADRANRADREAHAYPFLHLSPEAAFGEEEMRFDIIMGNPPYQLDDGGHGKSAKPLYHRFIETAKALEPSYLTFVIPARWYTGGKGLARFRKEMLADRHISHLVDYPDMSALFKVGVDIAGGGCYFLWDRDHDGDCLVVPEGDRDRAVRRRLDVLDVFLRDGQSSRILEKVRRRVEADGLGTLEARVWASNPFGIRAHKVPPSATEGPTGSNTVLLMTRDGDRFIRPDQIPRNRGAAGVWKVVISRTSAEHAGNPDSRGMKRVLSRSRVLPPRSACTETYLIAGTFSGEREATNFLHYLRTKFARFLLSLMVSTQDITRRSFSFVPAIPAGRSWTDRDLYDYFELDEEEVACVDGLIKEMPR